MQNKSIDFSITFGFCDPLNISKGLVRKMSEMPQQCNGYLPLCLHPEDVLSNEPTNFCIYKTETDSQDMETWGCQGGGWEGEDGLGVARLVDTFRINVNNKV